jgi:type VI secretion system protein VasJ
LLRTALWLELKALPPAEDGVTLVPTPSGSSRAELDALTEARDWLGLVRAAEDALVEAPLWLDPHRLVATALDRLGSAFADAKAALRQEVGHLLARLPSLSDLRFNDGSPFADEQTKAWLSADVASSLGAAGAGAPRVVDPVDVAIGAARTSLAQGNLVEGLATLAAATGGERSPLGRFRARLASAQLCLQAEQFIIGRAQLEGLDLVIVRHNLIEWDPELAAEFYAALYLAHRGANMFAGGEVLPDARAREFAAFEQLCRLDPTAALKLTLG